MDYIVPLAIKKETYNVIIGIPSGKRTLPCKVYTFKTYSRALYGSQIHDIINNTSLVHVFELTALKHDGYDVLLKVIYHPLYGMNNFVTNKSKLPQDGAQVFPYMG